MASGAKQILLSPASPPYNPQTKEWQFYLHSESLANQNLIPTCLTPTGLGNVSLATVKKRFAQSDEKPSRSRKKCCLIFPEWISR